MANLAKQVNWSPHILGKCTPKKDELNVLTYSLIRKDVVACGAAAPRWLRRWPAPIIGLSPYLARRHPFNLRAGRRFKTKIRCSAWRNDENESRDKCPRCGCGANTAAHCRTVRTTDLGVTFEYTTSRILRRSRVDFSPHHLRLLPSLSKGGFFPGTSSIDAEATVEASMTVGGGDRVNPRRESPFLLRCFTA